MGKPKLLIADSSEEFCHALVKALQGAYHIRCAYEGSKAFELVCSFLPDVLVVDLMLPGLDGISLLEKAAQRNIRPMTLSTTRYTSDYVLEAAARLNVCYVMIKPCDIQATIKHITNISHFYKTPKPSSPDPRSMISNILLHLGISTKLRGYGYIRESVLLMAKDPNQSITKELYPAVAAICGGTAVQIERSIRSAIHAAWAHRGMHNWQIYFVPDETGTIPRPTNASFISHLADLLILENNSAADE